MILPSEAQGQRRTAWVEVIHCDDQWRVIEFLPPPECGWIARSEWTDRPTAEAIRDGLQ